MRARLLCLSAVLAVLLPGSARVLGHHSFAAEFIDSETTWSGKVTKMTFQTPHVHFYLDVKDSSGKVVNWVFELPSPEQLIRRGLSRYSIKVGDSVTIVGYPGRDSQPVAMVRTVTLAEGQLVFVWDYEDFGPTKSDGIVVGPTGERQPR